MRRKRARGTRYLDEQETRIRVALDNTARSTSDEPHNRRKPRVGSTGTPELADEAVTTGKLASNLNGINAKVPNQEFTKDKVSSAGQWTKGEISGAGQWVKGEISGSGQWAKGELPGDIHYGKVSLGRDTQGTLDAADVGGNGKIAQKNLELPPIASPGDLTNLEKSLKKFMAKHYQKK